MPSHRVEEDWMGERVETLEDLVRPGLRAICVGINPSLMSVAAGHYYQGRAGQRFFDRLRSAGLLGPCEKGSEDDVAFAAGIGFTDIVKRPTARAKDVAPAEFVHGRERLLATLTAARPALVIFTYKQTAEIVFGRFAGNGFVRSLQLAESRVFVMPGPYEARETATATLRQLAHAYEGDRQQGLGIFDGLYEPGHLGQMRSRERS